MDTNFLAVDNDMSTDSNKTGVRLWRNRQIKTLI